MSTQIGISWDLLNFQVSNGLRSQSWFRVTFKQTPISESNPNQKFGYRKCQLRDNSLESFQLKNQHQLLFFLFITF